MPVLFAREPRAWDNKRDVDRAHAHRLLDAAAKGLSTATEAEITRALWITGDAVPVVSTTSGLADLNRGRLPMS